MKLAHSSSELGKELCEALGLGDKRVQSVDICIRVGEPVIVRASYLITEQQYAEAVDRVRGRKWVELTDVGDASG